MMSKGMELPKTVALLGMLMQYSTLFGQRFSTDYNSELYECLNVRCIITMVCDNSKASAFRVLTILRCCNHKNRYQSPK